jgi:hypothetical protein
LSSLLKNVAKRFEIPFRGIDPGSTVQFLAVLDEPATGVPPSISFTSPRRLMRVRTPSQAREGLGVQTPHGTRYLTARHGASELPDNELFESFQLYEITHTLLWERRVFEKHPVSHAEVDRGYLPMGTVFGAIEPQREIYDRGFSASFEAARFITNAPVLKDDRVADRKVTRVDHMLGLNIVDLQGG